MDAFLSSKEGNDSKRWKFREGIERFGSSMLVKPLLVFVLILVIVFYSWRPLLTYSQCIQEQLASVSPEYTYTIIRHTDVNGEDLMHVQAQELEVVKKVCDMFPNCAGFNSNGWLKTKVSTHMSGPADLYVKSEKQIQPASNVKVHSWGGTAGDYNEMLQRLKIYMYDTTIGKTHRTVRSGGYGVERALIDQLSISHFRTRKPEEATFYFIPIRCSSYILASSLEQEGVKKAKQFVGDMLEQIRRVYPYWDRSGGADHFYVCAHDIGAGVGSDLLKNAIALVNTADYDDPYFIPHKDISLPPNPTHGQSSLPNIGRGGAGVSPSSRTVLAFFAGDLTSGRIRPTLQRYFIDDPNFVIIDREVGWSAYLKYLKQSRFCLVPRGREVWSPRLMDAVFYGCIPVILSDHYHLPLQGIVDWKQFSVTVPESKIHQLKSILSSIPDSKITGMQKKLADVYTYFVWNSPAKSHDAFYSVMYQLWQRRNVVRYQENL